MNVDGIYKKGFDILSFFQKTVRYIGKMPNGIVITGTPVYSTDDVRWEALRDLIKCYGLLSAVDDSDSKRRHQRIHLLRSDKGGFAGVSLYRDCVFDVYWYDALEYLNQIKYNAGDGYPIGWVYISEIPNEQVSSYVDKTKPFYEVSERVQRYMNRYTVTDNGITSLKLTLS